MFRAVYTLALLLTLATHQGRAQVVLSPTHYELQIEVDYAEEVLHGAARITLRNPSTEPVGEVSLLLYRLLRVQAVRDEEGAALDFRQRVVAFQDFGQFQVNQILVPLAKPLSPGAERVLQVQYDGYLLGYAETGRLYVQDHIDPEFTILRNDSCAFPRPGFPSITVNQSAPPSSYTYSAAITVPEGLTVANGGRLEARDVEGGKVTFRFSSFKPSWRMDFAIARYGKLSSGGIRIYYLPGDEEGAAGVAQAAERCFDLYTRWFGPLQGEAALTFIEIPDGCGSQADVTTIIQTAAAFRDSECHDEVYHEISHLWNVSPTDLPSPRWNEGLATFLETLVSQELSGVPQLDARTKQRIDWLKGQLPDRPLWRQIPMIDYGKEQMTGASYTVGAIFFDLLYRLVGRDVFNQIIGRYYAKYNGSGGSTREFMAVASSTAESVNLQRLFDDWVFTTSWVDRIAQGNDVAALAEYYHPGGAGYED
jgi:hypothetical protein